MKEYITWVWEWRASASKLPEQSSASLLRQPKNSTRNMQAPAPPQPASAVHPSGPWKGCKGRVLRGPVKTCELCHSQEQHLAARHLHHLTRTSSSGLQVPDIPDLRARRQKCRLLPPPPCLRGCRSCWMIQTIQLLAIMKMDAVDWRNGGLHEDSN